MHPDTVPNPKVLLIAHELDSLYGICQELLKAGYFVYSASSYAEGVAILNHRSIDFVIVDEGTAAFEGKPILERAVEINRRLPVLVITRSVNMTNYMDAMQLGALDYLETPVNAELILRYVRAHTQSAGSLAF